MTERPPTPPSELAKTPASYKERLLESHRELVKSVAEISERAHHLELQYLARERKEVDHGGNPSSENALDRLTFSELLQKIKETNREKKKLWGELTEGLIKL